MKTQNSSLLTPHSLLKKDYSLNKVIAEATRRISQAIKPEKIYLFGSHAWGSPTPDSDIDLFIIINESNQPPYRRAREVYQALHGIRAPIEVVVRTREEVERTISVITSLTRKIILQGKLLYG